MIETALSFLGTIVIYIICKKLYQRTRSLWFMPMMLCPVVIIAFMMTTHISYDSYHNGGMLVQYLLSPVTVAFAIPLYRQRHMVQRYLPELTAVGTVAAVTAIGSTMGIARLLGVDPLYMLSLAPRSITTPLAMSVSDMTGGNMTITAIFVIVTGVGGMFIAVFMIRLLKIRNPILKGLMFGFTAHGTGTAKAYEEGERAGVMASMAMIFMGIITTLIAPFIIPVLLSFLI